MVGDQAVVEVRILSDECLNVLPPPEDHRGAAEVGQGAAQDDPPVPLVLLRQADVGGPVRGAPGQDILHIGILQDVVRSDVWCAENKPFSQRFHLHAVYFIHTCKHYIMQQQAL